MIEKVLRPELLEYNLGDGVRAFSTTRRGGVGTGSYGSFNITHYCNDAPDNVRRNRQFLCHELGIPDTCLFLPRQVHGTSIQRIDDDFLKQAPEERTRLLEGIDALLTDIPRICIGVSTADCIPILLYDETRHAIAAIHAGWRGTVARIAEKAVTAMQAAFGTQPANLRAVIGPGISQPAFEVGEEVYEAFSAAGFPMQQISRRFQGHEAPKWHIDLWAANFLQLEACGLPLASIQVSGICTYGEHDRFFSARRLGIDSGRIFNGILLR